MWIYALGKYSITKEKKDGFYFRLSSKEVNGEYRIYKIKAKEWLLERVDTPQISYLHDIIEPMLSGSASKPPVSEEYVYEVKWDGIRALISVEDGQVRIRTRNHNDVTLQFPELHAVEKAFRATCGLFDAEIVCLDAGGRPVFKKVISRLMNTSDSAIAKLSKTSPVYCYVFDCLYMDGRVLINEPLAKRREWLKDAIRPDTPYRISETVEDGVALFEAAKNLSLEGIMAKDKTSRYLPGKRSDSWLKIKVRNTAEVVIIGYTQGKGDRATTFGAMHIAIPAEEGLLYRGKVGTGYDDATMKEISKQMKRCTVIKKPIQEKTLDDKVSTWIEPVLMAEVTYAQITRDNQFREPVFVRMRPDLMP